MSVFLILLTFWFFRDPDRKVPSDIQQDDSLILSPADGIVTEIVDELEEHYLNTHSRRITIFLSPLNVHVNRVPVSGVVEFLHFQPGKFMIANKPDASKQNQQSQIGVSSPKGKILFKQIVGAVARRVVYDIKLGDSVVKGDRFGMMKFGSRMDIAIPIDADVRVKVGDKVVAAETIIAAF